MNRQVIINDFVIETTNFENHTSEDGRTMVSFDFQVTSEEYHDVTTLLYKNDFIVKVSEDNLEFPAVIHHYSTSITNLYKKGAVGNFKIELIEKA